MAVMIAQHIENKFIITIRAINILVYFSKRVATHSHKHATKKKKPLLD